MAELAGVSIYLKIGFHIMPVRMEDLSLSAGLEGLTEFQKPDQNIDPWYLCQLCHMEIDWNDVVDHVVTVLHRIKYIVST